MKKIITAAEAVNMIKPNDRVAIGGFLAVGAPETLIDALVAQNTRDIHLICIAADWETKGVGKLIANHQIKSVQLSHMGTNKEMQAQFNSGETKAELIPQGTLMERIRAFGAGLGGVLTPTGLGTIVQEGKDILEVNNKKYILEAAIESDFALIRAWKADKMGNLIYRKTARNCNPIMASAGRITIVEVDEIVETGQLDPDAIVTPGVYVNYIVKAGA